MNIVDKVSLLMDTDLLRGIDKWDKAVQEIKADMDTLEKRGYKLMEPWRIHWDHQLYKVLEMQYKQGLENLSESLMDLNCELIYKDQILQFR